MISSVSSSTSLATQALSTVSATQRHKEMFKKLDTDGDGKISLSELQAGAPSDGKGPDAAALMKQVDTNGDGTIDEAETDAFLTKMDAQQKQMPPPKPQGGAPGVAGGDSSQSQVKVYDKRDTNKDGKVSIQELMAAQAASQDTQTLMKSIAQTTSTYDANGDKQNEGTGEYLNVLV